MPNRRLHVGCIVFSLIIVGAVLIGAVQKAGTAEDAYRNHVSGVMVTAEGSVIRLLADDNDGSRHQRFIIRLN